MMVAANGLQALRKKMQHKLSSKAMSTGATNGDSYSTPMCVVHWLEKDIIQCKFTLDPCAQKHTAKAEKFFTTLEGGLKQSWKGYIVFCNPPHSRGQADRWLKKAYTSFVEDGVHSVVLVRADTGTDWFRKWVPQATGVIFTERISFLDPNTGKPSHGNSMASAFFLFGVGVPALNATCMFLRYEKKKPNDSSKKAVVDSRA